MSSSDRLVMLLFIPPVLCGTIGVVATAYHDHDLATCFAAGPRTKATVERVYRHDRERIWADISFRNVVNGRDVQCHSAVNAGRCATELVVGSIMDVAPKLGTCAEVASAFDE